MKPIEILKRILNLKALIVTILSVFVLSSRAAEVSSHLVQTLPLIEKNTKWPNQKPQWIVLDFWASWCAPCEESRPFFESQKKIWNQKNILWIGVNEDSDLQEAQSFLKKHESTLLEVYDPDKKLAHSLNIDSLPRLYVLDAGFKILWSEKGFTPEKRKSIEKQFKVLFH
jgi:thiol-disulfide isomerase/thioredoxin